MPVRFRTFHAGSQHNAGHGHGCSWVRHRTPQAALAALTEQTQAGGQAEGHSSKARTGRNGRGTYRPGSQSQRRKTHSPSTAPPPYPNPTSSLPFSPLPVACQPNSQSEISQSSTTANGKSLPGLQKQRQGPWRQEQPQLQQSQHVCAPSDLPQASGNPVNAYACHGQNSVSQSQPRRPSNAHQQQASSRVTARGEDSGFYRQSAYQREMLNILKTASDLQSLSETVDEHGPKLDRSCVASAFLRLEQLCQQLYMDGRGPVRNVAPREVSAADPGSGGQALAVSRAGASQMHNMPDEGMRHSSTIRQDAGRAGSTASRGGSDSRSTAQDILRALLPLLPDVMPKASLAQLANLMWVCAKLQSHTYLWPGLSDVVKQVTEQLMIRGVKMQGQDKPVQGMVPLTVSSSRYLSNLIYSLALLNLKVTVDKQLMTWLQEQLVTVLAEANHQDICNTAYALALLGDAPGPVWEQLCIAAASKFREPEASRSFSGQGLANVAWAIGKLGQGSPDVVPTIIDLLSRTPATVHTTNPRDAANVLWAAACIGMDNKNGWYTSRATLLAPMIPNMDMQLISMAIWAYATADVVSAPFLDSVLAVLKGRRPWALARKPMALVNIMWSLAKLEKCDTQVFLALQPIALNALSLMSPLEHQMLVWALGKFVDTLSSTEMTRYLDLLDLELTSKLLQSLKPCIPDMNAHEVGTLAAALTMLMWHDEDLNLAITTRMMQLTHTMTLPQVSTMLWYLTKIVVVETTPSDDAGPSVPIFHQPHLKQLVPRLSATLLELVQASHSGGMIKEIARCLWCCAILNPQDTHTIRSLMHVMSREKVESLDQIPLCMVAQALHAVCQLGGDDDLKWIQQEPIRSLVARAVSFYQGVAQNANPSATQLQVYAELAHVPGVETRQLEVPAADGMFRIDILVRYKGVDLGMEVDGPFHYMMNKQGQVTGDTLFRNRLLASHGYRLVCLRASEFTQLGTIQRRTQLLGDVLRLAVEDPAQLWHRDRQVGNALRGGPVLAAAAAASKPSATDPATRSTKRVNHQKTAGLQGMLRGSGGAARAEWQQSARRKPGESWQTPAVDSRIPSEMAKGGHQAQVQSADDTAVDEAVRAVAFAGSDGWRRTRQVQRRSALYQRSMAARTRQAAIDEQNTSNSSAPA